MAKKVQVDIKTTGAAKASKDLGKVDKGLGRLAKSAGVAAAGFFGARALISGFQSVIDLTKQQVLAETQLNAVLKSTGQVAGLTARELTGMASALQKQTRFGDEAIIKAQSLMLTFTKVGKEVFPDAIEAVLNMSEAMGQDLQQGVIQVGKALNDPILGVTALRRVGVQLSDQQVDLVKKFTETGEIAKAQKIILGELETQFGGVAKAAGETFAGSLDKMKNASGDAAESLGKALAPILIPMANNFTNLAISVSEFFKKLTETEIETRIRELQELGIETEHLEKQLRLSRAAGLTKEIDNSKSLVASKEEIRKKEEENKKLEANQQPLLDKIALNRLAHKDISKFNLAAIQDSNNERVLLEANVRIMQEKIDANNAIIEQNREQIDLRNQLNVLLSRPKIELPESEDEEFEFNFPDLDVADETYSHLIELDNKYAKEQEKNIKFLQKLEDEAYQQRIQNNLQSAILQGQTAKQAGISVIKAEVAEAQAGLISSIMKALPFPINLAVAAGAGGMIGKVTDQLFSSFATGGSFITKGRTTLPIGSGVVVGDNASGMERVDVTPLPSPTSNGNNINIYISAPLVDETVVDTIIPAIRRAEKLNL